MTNPVLERPLSGPADLALLVRQLRLEAEGVVSVELSYPGGGDLPSWRPGAHIELILPTGISRHYSLCGSPEDRSGYRIAVLRERSGRGGSEYIHAFLRPGQPVKVRGPRDTFRFAPAPSYLFIAGGIGITPILPMVREAEARDVPWRLVYGGRSASSMAFVEELRRHRDRVWLYPEDQVGLIPLDEWLDRPGPGTAIYVCGPEPLLAAVERSAEARGAGVVHTERFKPRPKPPAKNTEIEVVCARSKRTVTVPADRSVLGALEDEGIPVTGSCREGVCGTCETQVLDGTPDHRDDILSEVDRARGDRMFICVSRARDGRLVLDI